MIYSTCIINTGVMLSSFCAIYEINSS